MVNQKIVSAIAVLSMVLSSPSFVATASADSAASVFQTPEFHLVENLIAAAGMDARSAQGQANYRAWVNSAISAYEASPTPDPHQALQNLENTFQVMGISNRVLEPLRQLDAQYANLVQSHPSMTQTELSSVFQHYERSLVARLQRIPYPQGEQFSSCQWSVTITLAGLAIGIPLTAVNIGRAMGDQSTSGWIANTGAIALLAGVGGLIALGPTCF